MGQPPCAGRIMARPLRCDEKLESARPQKSRESRSDELIAG
jgi:hypothetical protein